MTHASVKLIWGCEPDVDIRMNGAEHLKVTALRLFAQRGIDGVTIREIAQAAGHKNHGIVKYYFGSKEDLVRQIVVDGARLIDERRNRWLDKVEADGGPEAVYQVIEGLVITSLDPSAPLGGEYYNSFVFLLSKSHRTLFMDALGGKWNSGYLRCLDHVRRLMPGLSEKEINQRFVFMGLALGSIIASREHELSDQTREHRMWADPATITKVSRALTAMIEY